MSSLDHMSRDELEKRVDTLEGEVSELKDAVNQLSEQVDKQPTRTVFNLVLSRMMNVGLDNYKQDPGQLVEPSKEFGGQMQDLDQRMSKVEQIAEEEESLSNDPSVANWQSIVETAQNLTGDADHAIPNNRVKLYGKQVEMAVGCSSRHALNLIEDYGADKRGADWKPHKRRKNGGVQKKSLVVDLNVWGDGDD